MIDNVNHPSHYELDKYECIDVMTEVFGVEAVQHFCLCNAFKYIWRTNRKNGIEDIEKAKWYLTKYLGLESKKKEKRYESNTRTSNTESD